MTDEGQRQFEDLGFLEEIYRELLDGSRGSYQLADLFRKKRSVQKRESYSRERRELFKEGFGFFQMVELQRITE